MQKKFWEIVIGRSDDKNGEDDISQHFDPNL